MSGKDQRLTQLGLWAVPPTLHLLALERAAHEDFYVLCIYVKRERERGERERERKRSGCECVVDVMDV